MQSLTTQRRHLKSFESDLGCGEVYQIEFDSFGKHFLNLDKEFLNVYDRKSWCNIIQKFNTRHLVTTLWSKEERAEQTESEDEVLQARLQSFLTSNWKRLQAHLPKMKKLRIFGINFEEKDPLLMKFYSILQPTLQDIPTHINLRVN
jgi:hypothetical protein